jgi:hypothetical protein
MKDGISDRRLYQMRAVVLRTLAPPEVLHVDQSDRRNELPAGPESRRDHGIEFATAAVEDTNRGTRLEPKNTRTA